MDPLVAIIGGNIQEQNMYGAISPVSTSIKVFHRPDNYCGERSIVVIDCLSPVRFIVPFSISSFCEI